MDKTVGNILKETRELKRLTLREVEIKSGISNAYLSQLENDKIKKPSANTLYKLSELLEIDFDDLMVAAGIVEKKKESSRLQNQFAFSADQSVTAEETEELLRYLKFMRSK